MSARTQHSGAALRYFVPGVSAAALATLPLLPLDGLQQKPLTLIFLVVLAGVAGLRPIRFPSRGNALTATHPVVLCALASLGPLQAVLTAISGLVASLLLVPSQRTFQRVLFNLSNVVLSTAAAWGAFVASGGASGAAVGILVGPLVVAAVTYYAVNTGLLAIAVSLERGGSPLSTWVASFRWTAASYLTGLTVAVAMLAGMEHLGPPGLALAIPPIWLMAGFYREHRARLHEEQHRREAVQLLNAQLQDKVGQLQESLAHVKRLQGLLPICMHCKKVRDDQDAWHRIETYIAEHSDVQFTHSLCQACREEHYPPAARIDRPENA